MEIHIVDRGDLKTSTGLKRKLDIDRKESSEIINKFKKTDNSVRTVT